MIAEDNGDEYFAAFAEAWWQRVEQQLLDFYGGTEDMKARK